MSTNCTSKKFQFPTLKKRKVVASFSGGSITSDGGGLLLREADCQLNILSRIAELFSDDRDKSKVTHSIENMLKQRVFGIALGYEDLNDHDFLRHDFAMQTFVNKDSELASSPTLCRFENKADRQLIVNIHKLILENFIESHEEPPDELILDFDATDDLIHGNQVGSFFHGYYKNYCFLPLYVFCGSKLLVSYLRPSSKDGALHAWAILSLLVKRLRQKWPHVKIIFRGDGGFCRHKMFDWCDKNQTYYITGLARNPRLQRILKPQMQQAEVAFEKTKIKQRLFAEFSYAAGSWSYERRVVGKAEHTEGGANPRFIVTNLPGEPQDLYDNIYCARGDMENRIKEQQLGLFANRTSCHEWWPNQLRLILSALAYIHMEYIRSTALVGTKLENAQMNTIRLKLFKIGAVVVKNTRRISFLFSSHYPLQELFASVYSKLVPI